MTRRLWDVGVPARDGVRLSADIYFPPGGVAGGPYPGVLARTPYDNQHPVYVAGACYLADRGYAVVVQDVRGRHDSEGDWIPFRQEGPDGYDTVEWMAEQPWCTGKVGTMGGSYGAWYQWALAREKPPHLTTMVSTATCGDWMRELPFDNGVILLVMLGWLNIVGGSSMQKPELVENWPEVLRHLPVREMDQVLGRDLPLWREWIDHPTLDDYWRSLRYEGDLAHVDVPVLHITGIYDVDQPGALYFYRGMRVNSPRSSEQVLVLGPWDHGGTRVPRQVLGDVDFGPAALMDMFDLHRRWFDRWLKDDLAAEVPSGASLFLSGDNRWYAAASFPVPGVVPTRWYLRSDGRANTISGDGALTSDRPSSVETADVYTYDPSAPVPSVLDENFYSATAVETPLDHRFKHRRDDVLCYTNAPASEELVLSGFPEVHLFASTDGPDTDWFVALHDVSPSGASLRLTEGRLRGRFHATLEREALLEAGETYEFVIPSSAIGHVLAVGHRLRLTVTSSDFPTWDRNLNTSAAVGRGTEMRVATNTVRHEPLAASHVVLPVVPRSALVAVADVKVGVEALSSNRNAPS